MRRAGFLQSVGHHPADADDQVVAFIIEGFEVGGVVGLGDGLEIGNLDAQLFLGALQALPGQSVEGLVVDSAGVGDHGDLEVLGGSRNGRKAKSENESQREAQDLFHGVASLKNDKEPYI